MKVSWCVVRFMRLFFDALPSPQTQPSSSTEAILQTKSFTR
ncbi:hypothetical protein GCK32_021104 [Trichostrongylus colubriformis]|uniref:Uncharacterized protein n=1 Tax=Trichostrongylus colubriformis TaxID=6319 RepID=A0AAN8FAI0_TRICO